MLIYHTVNPGMDLTITLTGCAKAINKHWNITMWHTTAVSKPLAATEYYQQGEFLGKTIGGIGKKLIYLAEGIFSLAMYMKTKNLLILGNIVVVAFWLQGQDGARTRQ